MKNFAKLWVLLFCLGISGTSYGWGAWSGASTADLVDKSTAQTITGDKTISGSLIATKACETGYERLTPNYCIQIAASAPSLLNLTRDACTTVTSPHSLSTAIVITAVPEARAANGVQDRTSTVAAYDDSSCSSSLRRTVSAAGREHVATTVFKVLDKIQTNLVVKADTPGDPVYLKFSDDAGDSGRARYYVEGYYD